MPYPYISQDMEELEIYVHIPFCVRKCNYCDFLSAPADSKVKQSYVNALIASIRRIGSEGFEHIRLERRRVTSVYFGGGTPSCLSAAQLASVLDTIREHFRMEADAEITVEVNPGTTGSNSLSCASQSGSNSVSCASPTGSSDSFAAELKAAGFNRVSIGLQSANDSELKLLGRIHSAAEFDECFHSFRRAGFSNISVDIMTAIPGQDEAILGKTLSYVTALKPEHISAYSLIIEPGTEFGRRYGEIEGPVIGTEAERRLYYFTVNTLKAAGYERYEISNFSLPGRRSRHNCGYWTLKEYLGLGLGASSYISGQRYKNCSELSEYIRSEGSVGFEENTKIDLQDSMAEFMFLGLRMTEGISRTEFNARYGIMPDEVYRGCLPKLIRDGLIIHGGDRIRLSDTGIDYGNYVFSKFLPE